MAVELICGVARREGVGLGRRRTISNTNTPEAYFRMVGIYLITRLFYGIVTVPSGWYVAFSQSALAQTL